jgi:thymidylate synthase
LYITDDSIDDLLNKVFKKIKKNGSRVTPTRGANLEILGVNLHLKKPRSRLSRSFTKGKVFSAFGELLWYLKGDNSLSFICHYLSRYGENSDDGLTVHGGYGPRLFGAHSGVNQLENIIELLKSKQNSRRAVIQLFESTDLCEEHTDIPCTTSLQFIIRDGFLSMFVNMRSNDAFKGLPHDIFAFTMIQEIVAKSLNVKLGGYHHYASSLHLYEDDLGKVEAYLDEGYHTASSMPEMPNVSPWAAIKIILETEENIRKDLKIDLEALTIDEYWKDICRILLYYKFYKEKNLETCEDIINTINHSFYRPYLKQKHQDAKKQIDQLSFTL